MTHSCEEHGHYCQVCEDLRIEERDEAEIQEVLENWNWNASVFDMYDELKSGDLGDEERQSRILHRAHKYFKHESTRKLIDELHFHMFGYETTQEVEHDSSND